MRVLFAEISAIQNDKPLWIHREDDENLIPVTPSQLTGGRLLGSIPDDPWNLPQGSQFTRQWLHRKRLLNNFWRHWKESYVSSLVPTRKWLSKGKLPIRLGQVVQIRDDKPLSRGTWRLGRIVKLHPSRDGLIRSVSLRCGKGIIHRPLIKLALLEGEVQADSPAQNST